MHLEQKILPSNCFSAQKLRNPLRGAVVHYFSCANVEKDAEAKFNTANCIQLFKDLNVPKGLREKYLLDANAPEDRMWASAHYLLPRSDTEFPALLVPTDVVAYHAGKSSYKGLNNWNDFSIGIELIGDATSGFTDYQYDCLSWIVGKHRATSGFPLEHVVGHEQIAPGRKVDPGIASGNFDLERLLESLRSW